MRKTKPRERAKVYERIVRFSPARYDAKPDGVEDAVLVPTDDGELRRLWLDEEFVPLEARDGRPGDLEVSVRFVPTKDGETTKT